MSSPGSQSSLPAAAGIAADATSPDEDLDEARDSEDGVPVGRADAEADKRRAEADAEED
jgi:hypothetical protein